MADGIRIPPKIEDKLKAINFPNSCFGEVIFSLANVQTLFQVKLEIIASSEAKAFAQKLITPIGQGNIVLNTRLNNINPKKLIIKPNPPTIPNLINFKNFGDLSKRILVEFLNVSIISFINWVEKPTLLSPALLAPKTAGISRNFAPVLES